MYDSPVQVHVSLGQVLVPDGCQAGDVINVELPAEDAAPPALADQEVHTEPQMTGDGADEYVGMYRLGARVSVLRTNGSYTPGTVKEYDELSDTYTMELEVSHSTCNRHQTVLENPPIPFTERVRTFRTAARTDIFPSPPHPHMQMHIVGWVAEIPGERR